MEAFARNADQERLLDERLADGSAEQRIAEFVARGLTNREVAAELVLSVHSVETALTRIYSKLGVRSRTELARRFADRRTGGPS